MQDRRKKYSCHSCGSRDAVKSAVIKVSAFAGLASLCWLYILLLLPLPAYAQKIVGYISFNSGTGFFVNQQYVITNAHVVKGCDEVFIKGAVPEHKATVKVRDEANDLALLETDVAPRQFAPLRFNIDDLKPNDKVLLMGYPGEAGARGEFTIATAKIEDMHDVVGSPPGWFYITDVVEHGNSGGPVFDTSGNVIGVVVAKSIFVYTVNGSAPPNANEKHLGAVIGLATLKQFLFDHGIYTEWLGSGTPYDDTYIEDNAKAYIVNVQCRGPEQAGLPPGMDAQPRGVINNVR